MADDTLPPVVALDDVARAIEAYAGRVTGTTALTEEQVAHSAHAQGIRRALAADRSRCGVVDGRAGRCLLERGHPLDRCIFASPAILPPTLPRFAPTVRSDDEACDTWADMSAAPDGAWVRLEDVRTALAARATGGEAEATTPARALPPDPVRPHMPGGGPILRDPYPELTELARQAGEVNRG